MPAPVNFSIKSEIPLAASNNFLPVKALNAAATVPRIPFSEIFSFNQANTVLKEFQIKPRTEEMLEPIVPNAPLNPPALLSTPENRSEIPVTILSNIPVIPSVEKLSFNETRKSPRDAAESKSVFPRSFSPSEPKSLAMASPTVPRTFLKISKTANTPLKVRFNLLAVSSLTIKDSVKFLRFSVIESNFPDVIGAKISPNASLIDPVTLDTASQIFQKD